MIGTAARRLRAARDATPLRVTLVAAVLVLVAVALALAGTVTAAALRGYLLDRVDGQLHEQSEFALSHPRQAARGFGDDGPRGLRPPSAYLVQVADATGAVAATAGDPPGAEGSSPRLPALPIAEARERDGRAFTVPAAGQGPAWRALVTALPDGSGSVTVAVPLGDVRHTVGRLVALEVAIGAAVLAVLGGAGYLVVRNSLRPLTEVEATAAEIAAGDLTRRVPARDPRTEVGRLSAAFNAMLGRIEEAFRTREASEAAARRSEERMRRFVADASHELRTPLTSIRGFAELYRQGAATGPADVARAMRRIEDEAARMGLLVDDLLLLARLDQQRPLERRPVDLLVIAADAVHDARAAAPGRSVDLVVSGGGVPVVTGDEARLRQVVTNLLGNALTHTPPDARVTVRLGTGDDAALGGPAAVLEVADTGPGLTPAEAERVFERFYRADPSRSRGSGGGSGLGLSIVAALTAAHGGRIELDTAPGQGATFRLLLPLHGRPAVEPAEEPAGETAGGGSAGGGPAGATAGTAAPEHALTEIVDTSIN